MLRYYLMDPDTGVSETEKPQRSYSFDFTAEQSSAIQSPNLLGREGTCSGTFMQVASSIVTDMPPNIPSMHNVKHHGA